MKSKDIAYIKILQYILKEGKVGFPGKGGFYDHFGMIPIEGGAYINEGQWPFSPRSLSRYVEDLCDMGIIRFEGKGKSRKYFFNSDKYFMDFRISKEAYNEIIQLLSQKGELDLKEKIQKLPKGFDDEKFVEMLEKILGVKNQIEAYGIRKDTEEDIKRAISESRRIEITYKNRIIDILPVALVNSSDKQRKYLFYAQKGKLVPPLLLSAITGVVVKDLDHEDKTKYIDDIVMRWDIQDGQETEIEIYFFDEMNVIEYVCREVSLRKNLSFTSHNDGYLLKGKIKGIDDFKRWLRKYSESCIIIKPEYLREEIIKNLQEKVKRYEVTENETS